MNFGDKDLENIHKYLNYGVELFLKGSYSESLLFFVKISGKFLPPQEEVRRDLYVGRILVKLKRFSLSVPFFLSFFSRIHEARNNCDLLNDFAFSLYECKCYGASLKICDLVEFHSRSHNPHFLETTNEDSKKYEKRVEKELDKIKRNMLCIKILNLVQLNEFELAHDIIRSLCLKYPSFPKGFAYKAIILESRNCLEAVKSICKAIELDPCNWKYYYFRGRIYKEIGKFWDSLEDFKFCYKINSGIYECLRFISEWYSEHNKPKKSEKYRKAYLMKTTGLVHSTVDEKQFY